MVGLRPPANNRTTGPGGTVPPANGGIVRPC